MSREAFLSTWLRRARIRRFANDALIGVPVALVLTAGGWRWFGQAPAAAAGLAGMVLALAIALWRARGHDERWLMRRLDACRADVENSADLLFADPADLGPLQRLQRDRLERRLVGEDGTELSPAWQPRRIAAAWALAGAAAAALLLVPTAAEQPPLAPSREDAGVPPGVPKLAGQRLEIAPPGYTRQPVRVSRSLDVRAPQGSRLSWTLRFDPQPRGADLVFHDGTRTPLRRDGERWTAERRLDRSMLYRVVPQGRAGQPLHRLDAVPDAPPSLRVLAPERGVTPFALGQRGWSLLFEATDDHGVAAAGQLRITVTEGEGENISFKERTLTLRGTGNERRRRFAIRLDPAALGLKRGNDLVAQLTIRDNRAPAPHVVRGPSVILRWPAELDPQGSGVEGVVKRALPAYFRSQRQIIIDAEQLLREKPRLAAQRFLDRSDAIGVDQRLLRLRYGQFLGEEASGGPTPPPTNDAGAAAAPVETATESHAHEEAASEAPPAFGSAGDVLADYGHTHDDAEAATLLDPETRATLKKALDAMWESELQLRQGDPRAALPHAYKALGFIKQVQQATRIFLQRVGPQLPPVDEARRMTGKRDGLESRRLPPVPPAQVAAAPLRAWQALDATPGRATGDVPLDALEHWLRGNEGRVPDALGLIAAIDAVRQDPDCTPCRARLRARLWTALPEPPARVRRRDDGAASGRRYLDALGGAR